MKKISIVTACYNEEANIRDLYIQLKRVLASLDKYSYEIIAIDNKSTDKTADILREIATEDKNFKVILNSKNFGPVKSPFYAMQQSSGDCMIYLVSDLQDPPDVIPKLVEKWENGAKIAVAVKDKSKESPIMWFFRQLFYKFISYTEMESSNIIENFAGFALYDKKIVELMKSCDDPNPEIKSFVSDIGFDVEIVKYTQSARQKGKSTYNLMRLYGYAMTIITKNSFFPIRFATLAGFILSILSFLIAIFYFVMKLLFWNEYNIGMASLIIGLFFFSAVQLFFIGIIGEYIAAIYTRVNKRPLVIEEERLNFDDK